MDTKIATHFESNLVVISGCSGGGKSTLIAELSKRGHRVATEPGRQVVQEQLKSKGDALPWKNPEKFLQRCLTLATEQYNEALASGELVWFDRSIVDALSALQSMQPTAIGHYAALHHQYQQYRYAANVFMAPPWPELFRQDTQRQHSFADATAEYERLLNSYPEQGYHLITLPKLSLAERADFVENTWR